MISAAKYHTSKLREFSDLEEVATFGFRGEALSSLCALSDMKIVTKHHSVDIATKLELNNRGDIVKQTACARQTGTTVTLTNLFGSLPVRKREFQRNIQKEFVKMCQILQGYGLISYGKRIILTNTLARGGKTTVLSTNGSQSIHDNIVAIFGTKQSTNLLKLRPPIQENETLTQDVLKSLDASVSFTDDEIDSLGLNRFEFDGYISSCNHGCGRSARDRQYFFINGRPCDPKSIIKLVNDTYHRFNVNQYPFIVLNICLERKDVDVNLTPDKRQLLVNNETILKLALKKSLLNTFGQTPTLFKMQNTSVTSSLMTSFMSVTRIHSENSFEKIRSEKCATIDDSNENLTQKIEEGNKSDVSSVDDDFEKRVCTEKGNPSSYSSGLLQWKMTGDTSQACSSIALKRRPQPIDDIAMRNFKMKKIHEYLSQDVQHDAELYSYKSESDSDDIDESKKQTHFQNDTDAQQTTIGNENDAKNEQNHKQNYRIDCKVKAIDTPDRKLKTVLSSTINNNCSNVQQNDFTFEANQNNEINNRNEEIDCDNTDTEVNKSQEKHQDDQENSETLADGIQSASSSAQSSQSQKIIQISTSMSEIEALMLRESKMQNDQMPQLNRMKFKAKIDPTKNKVAEEELKTEISKQDFIKMEIIGQFNLGFIIGRLDNDLFIIDQHATDEKYNFETLQKKTRLQNQPLVVPQSLELTPANEMILLDNLEVFEMNGFCFNIDMEQPVTKRIKLTAKPFSKNWEFGKEDIDELLFMLQEGAGDASSIDTCRPSRVRSMFASRACRSSVMIGTSLSHSDMRRLVDHMAAIEQPWVIVSFKFELTISFSLIFCLFLFLELPTWKTNYSTSVEPHITQY